MGNLSRILRNKETGELSEKKINPNYVTTRLVFDSDSRVVYYKFSEITKVESRNYVDQKPMDTRIGFMSPCLGEHGRPCKFINNEIVEIP